MRAIPRVLLTLACTLLLHAALPAQRFLSDAAGDALMQIQQRHYYEAIYTIDSLLHKYPGSAQLLVLKGKCQLGLRNKEGLDLINKAIKDSSTCSYGYYIRGYYHINTYPDSSRADFISAERYTDRSDSDYYELTSLALINSYNRTNEYDKAIAQGRTLTTRYPRRPLGYCLMAGSFLSSAEPDSAEACFRRALAIAPRYSNAIAGLAGVLTMRSRYTEAMRCFERALPYDTASSGIWNGLGFCLLNTGKPEQALAFFNRVLAAEPDNAIALNNRGGVMIQQKKYTEAMTDISRSLKLYPANAYAYRNLGLLNLALGLKETACENFRQALSLDYTKLYGDDVEALLAKYSSGTKKNSSH